MGTQLAGEAGGEEAVGLLVGLEALLRARVLVEVRQPPSCLSAWPVYMYAGLSVYVSRCLTWVVRRHVWPTQQDPLPVGRGGGRRTWDIPGRTASSASDNGVGRLC